MIDEGTENDGRRRNGVGRKLETQQDVVDAIENNLNNGGVDGVSFVDLSTSAPATSMPTFAPAMPTSPSPVRSAPIPTTRPTMSPTFAPSRGPTTPATIRAAGDDDDMPLEVWQIAVISVVGFFILLCLCWRWCKGGYVCQIWCNRCCAPLSCAKDEDDQQQKRGKGAQARGGTSRSKETMSRGSSYNDPYTASKNKSNTQGRDPFWDDYYGRKPSNTRAVAPVETQRRDVPVTQEEFVEEVIDNDDDTERA